MAPTSTSVGADEHCSIASTTRNSQLDVSMSQKVSRNFRVYLDVLNLNDALLRYYQGVPDRVLQEEHYHWWAQFGVKATF